MTEIIDFGIVGMGPAGIGVAMELGKSSRINSTICFERGQYSNLIGCSVMQGKDCRRANVCNIISSIGGASNLSAGKISNYPAGSGLASFFDSEQQLKDSMNQTLALLDEEIGLSKVIINDDVQIESKKFYSQSNIDYKYYDVYEVDSNQYKSFILSTVATLVKNGMRLYYDTEVMNASYDEEQSFFRIEVSTPSGRKLFNVRNLILATGSYDVHDELFNQLIQQNQYSAEIGVRVEAKTSAFGNVFDTHGDLKLKTNQGRTYCITKDGYIISYLSRGLSFLEGYMNNALQTQYSNLAVLTKYQSNLDTWLHDFYSTYRNDFGGVPIKQTYSDYVANKVCSIEPKTSCSIAKHGNINRLLPVGINDSIKCFIQKVLIDAMGMKATDLTIVAPELKIMNSFEISNNFEASRNLFVVGAATGSFRGILQSLCSGLRCGQILLRKI